MSFPLWLDARVGMLKNVIEKTAWLMPRETSGVFVPLRALALVQQTLIDNPVLVVKFIFNMFNCFVLLDLNT